jgi:hypothetical protein
LRQGARRDQSIGADIGTEVDEHLATYAEDRAVAAAGDLDLAIRLARMVHRGQMLAPVLQPADWPADMPRAERDQEVLRIELATGAKTAANVAFDQVDLGWSQAQHPRQGIAVEERQLRGAEHRHPALRPIPFGKHAARLHRQCRIALDCKPTAPDIVGVAKRRVGIALDPGKDHRGVCAGFFKQQDLASLGSVPMRDGRQRFDIEGDCAGPVLGHCWAVAQNDGDRLVDIADAVRRDHWLEESLRAGKGQKTQRDARHGADILRRDDGMHAGNGTRGGGVDGGEEAVGNGTAQDGCMQHALALQVADELATAAQKA